MTEQVTMIPIHDLQIAFVAGLRLGAQLMLELQEGCVFLIITSHCAYSILEAIL